jgi:CelD/BcsL family acetyltransferase involved in cellulose biosynthesis
MLGAMASLREALDPGVEVVRDVAGLQPLEEEWRRLAVDRGNAFIAPEWFTSWWRHYAEGHAPHVVVVRGNDGRLRGLLPLVTSTAGRTPTVRFAGSSLGDHFHPASPVDGEAVVGSAAARALRSQSRRCPTVVLENVDAGAAWWRELSRLGAAAPPIMGRESSLPCIRLAGLGWEEYLGSRSRNLRSQVRRKRRALEREQALRVRWIQERDDIATEMATLFRLHDARWAGRNGRSSMTGERVRAFLTDFAASASSLGWLRLCFLEVEGQPVAGWFGWRLGARFAYYQAGFDPAWASRSVGFILFAETIRAAAEEGAAEYDMLLGEERFKERFATSSRPVCTAVIAPRLRPSRLLATAEVGLRRAGRRLPEGVREPAKERARSLLDRLPMARQR